MPALPALVDALRAENRVLSESLNELPEEAASPAGFSVRAGRGCGVTWRAGRSAGAGFDHFRCGSMKLSIPAALEWFNPFSLSGRTNLIFDLSYYVCTRRYCHAG